MWKPPPPAVKKDEPKVLLMPEKNTDCDSSPPIRWKCYPYILQRCGFQLNDVKSLAIGYEIAYNKSYKYLNVKFERNLKLYS